MLAEERGQTDDNKQYQREHRSIVEQVGRGDIILNEAAEQLDIVMRQQFCDGEGRDGRHKHHYDTTVHTRHGQRDNHFPETLPTAGTQVLRRLDERVVHLLQRVVYRVNHKGQVVVAEAEEQCSFAQRQTAHIE